LVGLLAKALGRVLSPFARKLGPAFAFAVLLLAPVFAWCRSHGGRKCR